MLNSTLHIPSPSFPTCPLNSKLTKFSHLALLRRKSIIYTRTRLLCTPSQSSSSTAMEAPPQGYRRNVAICLVNDSKIFAASRLDIPSAWQMPQVNLITVLVECLGFCAFLTNARLEVKNPKGSGGDWGGIDEAEDSRSAAIREIRKETAVKSAESLAEAPYWLTYDFRL
ncbi:hypothetical protein ACFX13_030901 [Malus domestica]